MLGTQDQATRGMLTGYTSERSAYMKSAGSKYTAVANPTDVMSLTDWIAGMPTAEQKPIDAAHAVLVEVTWAKLAGNNAGWEIWVVNPVPGGWELYEAR
jgi:hypothetical protein